jgi:hypothetical protein
VSRNEAYTVAIDYDRPFAEVVTVGAYDQTNDDVTETSFPTDAASRTSKQFSRTSTSVALGSSCIRLAPRVRLPATGGHLVRYSHSHAPHIGQRPGKRATTPP